jgi:hypothetical protein
MKTYNIYKKRDGQSFETIGDIFASNFKEAKQIFAKQMTDDNHELSNNVQWLDKEEDGVFVTGWYDFNGGSPLFNEDTEKYDPKEAEDFLLISEKDISKGFSRWNEDVYTWAIEPKNNINNL